ncbi:MAG TPA: PLP-dependent aminotransferase family protein [Anaerolineae bacterium]
MEHRFATRTTKVKRSFLREIMKATDNPDLISFAGGLPNPQFFPVEALAAASTKVLTQDGPNVLQYSRTEGYLPLRQFISRRYRKNYDLNISPDEILITTGSQQALDLIGKVFLDRDDDVAIERPGYLGAIQTFSFYEPNLRPVPLRNDGVDVAALAETFERYHPKLFYAVPNFQNPSGLSYSAATRQAVAELLQAHGVMFVEDNPYGELRFVGEDLAPLWAKAEDHTLLLGSFSKIVSPGLRLGWICAKAEVMDKLVVAKQATDLHSSYLSQRVLFQYLSDNNLEEHIETIRLGYKQRRDLMIELIDEYFPPEVSYTEPEGGMFLWLTLPEGMAAMELFNEAVQFNVAFVPGEAFYIDGGGRNTLRLNYSNADEEKIQQGIYRLGEAIKKMMVVN